MDQQFMCTVSELIDEFCRCDFRMCRESQYCIQGFCYDKCESITPFDWPCVCGNETEFQFCGENERCYKNNRDESCIPCDIRVFNENCVCGELQTHCRLCENRQCTACNFGYYLLDGMCYLCDAYSQNTCTCVKAEIGTLEELNKEIDRTLCQTCDESLRCKTCINNTYFDEEERICKRCADQSNFCICGGNADGMCRECSDQYFSRCKTCFDGYYIDSAEHCAACGAENESSGCFCGGAVMEGCSYCASGVCIGCEPGWLLADGACIRCETHCLSCVSSTVCRECDEFSYLNGSHCETCVNRPYMVLRGGFCVCDEFHFYLNDTCHSKVLIYLVGPLLLLIASAYVSIILIAMKRRYLLHSRS